MRKIYNLYYNMSIKSKMRIGFYTLIFFTITIGFISILNTNRINNGYLHLLNYSNEREKIVDNAAIVLSDIKRGTMALVVNAEYLKNTRAYTTEFENIQSDIVSLKEFFDLHDQNMNHDSLALPETKKLGLECSANIIKIINDELIPTINELNNVIEKNYSIRISKELNNAVFISNSISDELDILNQLSIDTTTRIKEENTKLNNSIKIFTVALTLVIIIIAALMIAMTSISIVKPIKRLRELAEQISNGNFNVQLTTNCKDEIGKLSNDIGKVVDVIRNITLNINELSNNLYQGNLSSKIDDNNYEGEFKITAQEVNKLSDIFMDTLQIIADGILAYSNGDMDYVCPEMKGDKVIFKEALDNLKNNIYGINKSINDTLENANNGILDSKIDLSLFNGKWKVVAENINNLMENIFYPIQDVSNALKEVSKGNLNANIHNTYKGKFGEMTQSINLTISILYGYINEISYILNEVSHQNFNVKTEKNYTGDFSKIEKSLSYIIENLSSLIINIKSSSDNISLGSKQIASVSVNLAEGSSAQLLSIKDLNKTVNNVFDIIKHNTENSVKMDLIAQDAKLQADSGNNKMKNMLHAMNQINISSENISNIIKVIQDIAFQTNILALNAAIEAARAGVHGKGFSVVADEVRNLAAKSHKSAKETTILIQTSLENVQKGIEIADDTANTLESISQSVNGISNISSEISDGAKKQETSINTIITGIDKINEVANNNTISAEESAAASEQLASQAELFKDIVDNFKVKTLYE